MNSMIDGWGGYSPYDDNEEEEEEFFDEEAADELRFERHERESINQ